jgi:hypothetical protein
MLRLDRRPVPAIAGALFAGLLLAATATPSLAKEFMQATLDAPIAMGTPGGTEILVGMKVTAPDGEVMRPVEGSPIYLKLTGRDGSFTEASGRVDETPGHYTMRIAIPEGGARRVEVVIRGTSNSGTSDLPIILMADPFAFGGITARTAQVAPTLAPPITPFPRASAAAVADSPAAAVTAAPSSVPSPLPYLLAAAGLTAVVGLALAMQRRSRRIAPERTPDA